MKNKLVNIMVLGALFSPAVYAADDVTSHTMLEEIADLRQQQQLEQAKVDMLTVKQKRIELELSNETAAMAEPLPVDSTSFDLDEPEDEGGSVSGEGDGGNDGPSSFAQWDVPGGMNQQPVLNNFPVDIDPEPKKARVKLLNVVGFTGDLKARIQVDGARKTVKVGEKIRGTKITIKAIDSDFIEIEEDGKTRFIDFAGDPKGEGDTPLVPVGNRSQGAMSVNQGFGGFSGVGAGGMGGSIEQPLPVIE